MSVSFSSAARGALLAGCALITLAGLGCDRSTSNTTSSPASTGSSNTGSKPATQPSAGTTPITPRTCSGTTCTYENSKEQFSIQYPSSWDIREGSFGTLVSFLSPLADSADQFSENVNVVNEMLGADKVSLSDYYKASEDNLKKYFSDFKILKNDATTLGGMPARIIVYSATQGPVKLRTTQIFTIKDSKAYIVTLTNTQTNPDLYYADMMKIAQSFKFTK